MHNEEVLFTEIETMTLSEAGTDTVKDVVRRMLALEKRYVQLKKLVREMDEARANNTFRQWEEQHPNSPNYPRAKAERDGLREQRNNEFYNIESVLMQVLRVEHPNVFNTYVLHENFHGELHKYKKCLELAHYYSIIDADFKRIEHILGEGLLPQIPQEELDRLANLYVKYIKLLKEAYVEHERVCNQNENPSLLHFIDELEWKEPLNTLSFLSIVRAEVLEPLNREYSNTYQEYLMRYYFIKNFKDHVSKLRNQYIQECRESEGKF